MTTTVFVDTETTGLDPARHEPWEVALIVRSHHRPEWDGEWVFQLAVDLAVADATALNVGRFWQRRHPDVGPHGDAVLTRWPTSVQVRVNGDRSMGEAPGMQRQGMTYRDTARLLAGLLAGAVVVGSNPAFDLAMLTALLAKQSIPAPWHYRPVDVVTLAAGYLRAAGGYDELTAEPAYRSEVLAAECSVHLPDAAERHTALGDARWVQRWYDVLMGHLGLAGLIVEDGAA